MALRRAKTHDHRAAPAPPPAPAPAAKELLGGLTEHMAEGVCLVRAGDAVIVYANSNLEAMLGLGAGELVGEHISSIANGASEAAPRKAAGRMIGGLRRHGTWSGELESLRTDGTPLWGSVQAFTFDHPEHGEVWVVIHADITDLKRLEEEMDRISSHDELTGLANRRLFREHLDRERAIVTRRTEPAALLAIGIDGLDRAADEFGAQAADRLVKHVTRITRHTLRASDILARVGDDELAAIVPGATSADAAVVATKLLRELRSRATRLGGREWVATISIGVAVLHPTTSVSSELLLASADQAMEHARQAGGDRFVIAEEEAAEERPSTTAKR
jgi:diguanylate cyclase (GGDEF)-like protein/PAS domain S-box-containing protein